MNNIITYSQMVNNLAKPGQDIMDSLTPAKTHLWHMITGLGGEFMEIELALNAEDVKQEHVCEELGDLMFYLTGILNEIQSSEPTVSISHFPPLGRVRAALLTHCEELFDKIKKHVMYNKDLNAEDVYLIIVDIVRQIVFIGNQYGLTLKMIKDANMRKLLTGMNARYSEGSYSDGAAQARADKGLLELTGSNKPIDQSATADEPGSALDDETKLKDEQSDLDEASDETKEEADPDFDEESSQTHGL